MWQNYFFPINPFFFSCQPIIIHSDANVIVKPCFSGTYLLRTGFFPDPESSRDHSQDWLKSELCVRILGKSPGLLPGPLPLWGAASWLSILCISDSWSSAASEPPHHILLPSWNLRFLYFLSSGLFLASEELTSFSDGKERSVDTLPPASTPSHKGTPECNQAAHLIVLPGGGVPLVEISSAESPVSWGKYFHSDPVMKDAKVCPWTLKQTSERELWETC